MSIKDYEVARDRFEADDAFSGFCFPCGACQHRKSPDSVEPCRSCDHNANAQPDAGAVRYPVPGAPFDEPMEPVRECGTCGDELCELRNWPVEMCNNWKPKGE